MPPTRDQPSLVGSEVVPTTHATPPPGAARSESGIIGPSGPKRSSFGVIVFESHDRTDHEPSSASVDRIPLVLTGGFNIQLESLILAQSER